MLVIVGVLIPLALRALVIGSDETVSRNAFFTFPASDTDNEIRGFALMNEGFALEDATTSCLFNAFEPVRQKLFLNGGSLSLQTNLFLENLTTFTNLGRIESIDGELKSLVLADNTSLLGIDTISTVTFENVELVLNHNVTLDSPIVFSKNGRIIGNGHIFTLSDEGALIVGDDATLILQNITLSGLRDQKIRCSNNDARLILQNVFWFQDDSFTFDTGSILFQKAVNFSGTSTFRYESAYTSTIDVESMWRFVDGIFLRIGRHPISQAEPLAFIDRTSIINFDNVNFEINEQGIQFTKGKMRFTRTVSFAFDSTTTLNGVELGTSDPPDDFIVEFAPASVLSFTKGHLVYNNSIPDGLRSLSQTSHLVRSPNSVVFVAQNLALADLNFINNSLLVLPPIINTGKTLTFSSVQIDRPNGVFDITAQQFSPVALLLRGDDDQIFITKGSLPVGLVVQSTGSTIRGTGTIDGPIILTGPTVQLNWTNLGTLSSTLIFNGGTVTLNSDLFLVSGGVLVGPGVIDLNNKAMQFGVEPFTQSTPLTFQGEGTIKLNSKATIASTLTFQNKCTIEGKNNILDLSSGELVIDSGATLILKDLILDQVSGTNIRCVDDTGIIQLNNTKIILDGTFTFTNGAFKFQNKNTLSGLYSFAYQSIMTSTILADSQLIFDNGFTFSYDPPIFDGSNKLLQFIDDSSELVFNGSSMITTTSGIELTKGTTRVKRTSNISSDVKSAPGITFGDGANVLNDLKVIVLPGVQLNVTKGSFTINNVSPSKILLLNPLAALHMNANTFLKIRQNLTLNDGSIFFDANTVLGVSKGKVLAGSINPLGKLVRLQLSE